MKFFPFVIVLSLLSTLALAADVPWAEGILKKIDQAAGKATIAHGPIDSVGMGPMTMQFAVKDAAGLAKRTASNNPEKAKPKKKAQERAAAKAAAAEKPADAA
jgi:hypothetical protein